MKLISWNVNGLRACLSKGFEESLGVPAADARDYSVLGCQELEIPGKSNFGCEDGLINLAKILEITLHGGRTADGIPLGPNTGDWTEFEDFEALWQAFETQLCFFTRHFAELTNMGQTVRAANYAKLIKAPFTSDCIARGKTSDEGGALYNFGCVETMGAACTADSLTAIKRLCFEEKRLDISMGNVALFVGRLQGRAGTDVVGRRYCGILFG